MTREDLIKSYGMPSCLPEYIDKKANTSIRKNIIFSFVGIVGIAILVVDGLVRNPFTLKNFIGLIFAAFTAFFIAEFIAAMAHTLRQPGICWKVKVISCKKKRNANRGLHYKVKVKFPNGYTKECSTKTKCSEGEYAYFYTKENDGISSNDKQLIEYIFKSEE